MGLKAINVLTKAVTKKACVAPKTAIISETVPNKLMSFEQTVQKGVSKIKTKFFTKAEMLDMKPSEFKQIMESRTDIPENMREWIQTPEKLNLYDEVVQLDVVQKMEPAGKEEFLNKLFGQFNLKTSEASAQLEVIPDLIKKGYDPQTLALLPIREDNKNLVEVVLKRTDLLEKYSNKYRNAHCEILKFVNEKNFKYIDECFECGGTFYDLPYWTEDTTKIIRKFFPKQQIEKNPRSFINYVINAMRIDGYTYESLMANFKGKQHNFIEYAFEQLHIPKGMQEGLEVSFKGDQSHILTEILDKLHRNGHTYESVRMIFGDKPMTAVTQRLLEYKKFNKFKDIGLGEFDKLSVADKKEFIRGYISAITPKELLSPKRHNLENGIEELQNSMKIYRELNPETTETLVNSYNNTLRALLNKLPEKERQVIRSTIDTKFYRRQYRLDNPIPSLVDEIGDVLKVETRTINGRTVKYAEMSCDVEFGISTHRFPNPESILTIEALEEVDPKMLLCVGTKGGPWELNVDKTGHALVVKPRKAFDWHVQAYSDIDSGNNATKNIYNFEHIMLPRAGNHCDAIDLIPNAIKKELNLSQREYTSRMKALKNCRTLGEIGKKDPIMEKAIRKVIKEQNLYEGLMRTEAMGVTIPENMPLENISEDIINYCIRRDIPIIRVLENVTTPKKTICTNFTIEV